ncbi:phage integrase family protein [Dokdonella fugitiva]|uniref:Phage integrase family protein n=1 Tax=Dokdonella fugitiva TaxID=328517 RepID=A0A4R2IC11_9GAMM|nr:phage integrase family protein [Dokdonella fugitiva]
MVLAKDEVVRLLAVMEGRTWLMASLLYGAGMRLMECLRLRVKDVDFARNEILVRDGKGGKDRRTMLPRSLVEPLQREIERSLRLHAVDLAAGFGATRLPHALMRNIRARRASLVGSSCLRRRSGRAIRSTAPSGVITSTMPSSPVRSRARVGLPRSPNR